MKWVKTIPNKPGFWFLSITDNPKQDNLIRIEQVFQDEEGNLYGKNGYVDNNIYASYLFSDSPLEIPDI